MNEEQLIQLYNLYAEQGASLRMAKDDMARGGGFDSYSEADYRSSLRFMEDMYSKHGGEIAPLVEKKKEDGESDSSSEGVSTESTLPQTSGQQAQAGGGLSDYIEKLRTDGLYVPKAGSADPAYDPDKVLLENQAWYINKKEAETSPEAAKEYEAVGPPSSWDSYMGLTGDVKYVDAYKYYWDGDYPDTRGDALNLFTSADYKIPEFYLPGAPSTSIEEARQVYAVTSRGQKVGVVSYEEALEGELPTGFLKDAQGRRVPVGEGAFTRPYNVFTKGQVEGVAGGFAVSEGLPIAINVTKFLNNNDPDFEELFGLSMNQSFRAWMDTSEFFQDDNIGVSGSPNAALKVHENDIFPASNMGEVIADMSYVIMFGEEIGTNIINGALDLDDALDLQAKKYYEESADRLTGDIGENKRQRWRRATGGVLGKYTPDWVINTELWLGAASDLGLALPPTPTNLLAAIDPEGSLRAEATSQLHQVQQSLTDQFYKKFTEHFKSQITNTDLFTDEGASTLVLLEKKIRNDYGIPMDISGDGIVGDEMGNMDATLNKLNSASAGVALSLYNLYDWIGSSAQALDNALGNPLGSQGFTLYGPSDKQRVTKEIEGYSKYISDLEKEIRDSRKTFQEYVENGDYGGAFGEMTSGLAGSWPVLASLVITRKAKMGPTASAFATSMLMTSMEAGMLRSDPTFNKYIDEEGNEYNYYEAIEKAKSSDPEDLEKMFTVERDSIAEGGYLASKLFSNAGVFYVGAQQLRNFSVSQQAAFVRGWAGNLGIALTEQAAVGVGAEVFSELVKGEFTGSDRDFYEILNDALWHQTEMVATGLTLYGVGQVGARAAASRAARSDALSTAIGEEMFWDAESGRATTRTPTEDLFFDTKTGTYKQAKSPKQAQRKTRRAMNELEKKLQSTDEAVRAEAIDQADLMLRAEGLLYRQNHSWLTFLSLRDTKNNTKYFEATVNSIERIDQLKRQVGLTNDEEKIANFLQEMEWHLNLMREIFIENKDEFYKEKGIGGGVYEQERMAATIGETPERLFGKKAAEIRNSRRQPATGPKPSTDVSDIADLARRSEAMDEARKKPTWMMNNVGKSNPTSLDMTRLQEILNSDGFAILTGEFPSGVKVGLDENNYYLDQAKSWLEGEGVTFHEITGRFEGKGERSLLVEEMTDQQVENFLVVFGQHSAVRAKGLVKANGDYMSMEGNSWEFSEGVTETTDNTSAIKLSDGTVVTFSKEDNGQFFKGSPVTKEDGTVDEWDGSGKDGTGFWDPLPREERQGLPQTRVAEVSEEFKVNRLSEMMHKAKNLGASLLHWGMGIRTGKYTAADGTVIKINDQGVIEAWRSLNREKANVTNITRADMYQYSAIMSSMESKGMTQEQFSGIMRGEISMEDPSIKSLGLTDADINSVNSLRQNVDILTDQLIMLLEGTPAERGTNGQLTESGKQKLALIDTLRSNRGSYLTRSYEIFSDGGKRLDLLLGDKKKMPPELRAQYDAAVRLIAMDMTSAQLSKPGAAEDVLKGYLKSLDSSRQTYGELDIIGNLNNGILKARNNQLPKEFSELLGLIENPTYEYFATVSKLRSYITNYTWQTAMSNSLLSSGMGGYNINQNIEGPFGKYVPVYPNARPNDPLYGMMVPEMMYDALQMMTPLKSWRELIGGTLPEGGVGKVITETGNGVMWAWTGMSSLAKLGSTAYSIESTMRNALSGNLIQWGAGHWWLSNPEYALDTVKAVWTDDKGKPNRQAWMDEKEKLTRYGILGESVRAGELTDTMYDLLNKDYSKGFDEKGGILKKGRETLLKFYSFGDEFYKVMGYYQERDMLIKSGELVEDAESMAAQRIRDMYPTYSQISRGVQGMRRLPTNAPFPSFAYEMVRNRKNALYYAAEDLASGDPNRVKAGMYKIVGSVGMSTALPFLAWWAAEDAGMDDEEYESRKRLRPDYQQDALLIYTGGYDEKGNPYYVNMSYTVPTEPMDAAIRVLLGSNPNDEDYLDRVGRSLDIFFDPFMGSDIFTGTVNELLDNKDENGRKVYRDPFNKGMVGSMMDDEQAVYDVAQHLIDNLAPGMIRQTFFDVISQSETLPSDHPLYELQQNFKMRYPEENKSGFKHTPATITLGAMGVSLGVENSEMNAEYRFRERRQGSTDLSYTTEEWFCRTNLGEMTEKKLKDESDKFIRLTVESLDKTLVDVSALKKTMMQNAIQKYSDPDERQAAIDGIPDDVQRSLMDSGYSFSNAWNLSRGYYPNLSGISANKIRSTAQKLFWDDPEALEDFNANFEQLLDQVFAYNELILEWNIKNAGGQEDNQEYLNKWKQEYLEKTNKQ